MIIELLIMCVVNHSHKNFNAVKKTILIHYRISEQGKVMNNPIVITMTASEQAMISTISDCNRYDFVGRVSDIRVLDIIMHLRNKRYFKMEGLKGVHFFRALLHPFSLPFNLCLIFKSHENVSRKQYCI